MSSRADQIAQKLNEQRKAFKAFLVARVGSEADADDILQNGLVKALRHGDEVTSDEKSVAWFYQLLRNAVVDHYRNKGAVRRRDESLGQTIRALDENSVAAPPEWEPRLCGCLLGVVATLPFRPAELLRRVDLSDESLTAVAKDLKITPNLASVTLHRARIDLRKKLEAFCGACAEGACLDCDCQPDKNS